MEVARELADISTASKSEISMARKIPSAARLRETLHVLVDGPRTSIFLDITGISVVSDSSNSKEVEYNLTRDDMWRMTPEDRVRWLEDALEQAGNAYWRRARHDGRGG